MVTGTEGAGPGVGVGSGEGVAVSVGYGVDGSTGAGEGEGEGVRRMDGPAPDFAVAVGATFTSVASPVQPRSMSINPHVRMTRPASFTLIAPEYASYVRARLFPYHLSPALGAFDLIARDARPVGDTVPTVRAHAVSAGSGGFGASHTAHSAPALSPTASRSTSSASTESSKHFGTSSILSRVARGKGRVASGEGQEASGKGRGAG